MRRTPEHTETGPRYQSYRQLCIAADCANIVC